MRCSNASENGYVFRLFPLSPHKLHIHCVKSLFKLALRINHVLSSIDNRVNILKSGVYSKKRVSSLNHVDISNLGIGNDVYGAKVTIINRLKS